MTLDTLIMLLGTFVAILPFLGFPNSWDNVLLLGAGIIIVLLGMVVRFRNSRRLGENGRSGTYVENFPHTGHEA
jgi:hypothetical protein